MNVGGSVLPDGQGLRLLINNQAVMRVGGDHFQPALRNVAFDIGTIFLTPCSDAGIAIYVQIQNCHGVRLAMECAQKTALAVGLLIYTLMIQIADVYDSNGLHQLIPDIVVFAGFGHEG